MKVIKSRKISDAIEKHMSKMGIESFLNTTIITPVTQNEVVFKERGKLQDAAVDFKNQMAKQGLLYTEDESLIGAMLVAMLNESGNLNEQAPLYMNLLIKNSFVFHKGDIEENPYYQSIQFEDVVAGRYTLGHNSYAKYELFQCDLKEIAGMLFIPRLATFDHRFKYPAIMEGNETWMSVTPGEIITMKAGIEHAKGRVLTLGLGMGYFAFMASQKDEVSCVTIIEQSEEVIRLFNTHILPQFPHADKITVIKADALDYMKGLEGDIYDYCYGDFWIGTMDYVPYLKLRAIATKFQKMQMEYWIKEELDFTISMSVFKLIMSEHDGLTGAGFYESLTEEEKYLWNLLLEEVIEEPGKIEELMKTENLVKRIR